jgi:hypothetical protein
MSKKLKSGFYLLYNANCSPIVHHFNSLKERTTFIVQFTAEHGSNEDYWIDALIEGKVEVLPNSGVISIVKGKYE